MAAYYESSSEDEDFLAYSLPRVFAHRNRPFEATMTINLNHAFVYVKEHNMLLLGEIEHHLEHNDNRGQSVSPINQLLLALQFYATGTFQLVVGDAFGVDKSTACRIVHKVSRWIASLRKKLTEHGLDSYFNTV